MSVRYTIRQLVQYYGFSPGEARRAMNEDWDTERCAKFWFEKELRKAVAAGDAERKRELFDAYIERLNTNYRGGL